MGAAARPKTASSKGSSVGEQRSRRDGGKQRSRRCVVERRCSRRSYGCEQIGAGSDSTQTEALPTTSLEGAQQRSPAKSSAKGVLERAQQRSSAKGVPQRSSAKRLGRTASCEGRPAKRLGRTASREGRPAKKLCEKARTNGVLRRASCEKARRTASCEEALRKGSDERRGALAKPRQRSPAEGAHRRDSGEAPPKEPGEGARRTMCREAKSGATERGDRDVRVPGMGNWSISRLA